MPNQPPSLYSGDPRVKNAREQMALNRLRQYLAQVLFNIPERMTTAERTGLPDQQNHRLVWDLDLQEMYYWDGTWILVGSGGAGGIEILERGVSLGEREAIDFGDGFEIDAVGTGVSCQYPQHVTTTERIALSPRQGTVVYDTDQGSPFWFNGIAWVEV